MILVYDTEGDGFRDDCTRLWCVVAQDYNTREVFQFGPDQIEEGLRLLGEASVLVCHNQIAHDLPIMLRLYGFLPSRDTRIHDTLVMSRVLWPDRPIPKGAEVSGGPHSVEAWGARFRRPKPVHEDWTRFSPEMLHRCTEDVEIQRLIYRQLKLEMKR